MDRIWLKRFPAGVPADIDPGAYASITALLAEACAKYRHLPAFTNMGTSLSYAQLDELSRSFAAWLQKKSGLVAGDRVALMLPNILQYPIALFGVLRAGMIVVNTNPLYTARELEAQLVDSGAKAIVILENFAHVLQAVLPRTSIAKVLVTGVGDLLGLPRGALVNFVLRHVRKQVPPWSIPESMRLKSALSSGLGLKLVAVEAGLQDIAFLQYTGGTTGVSKAAVLTHGNIVANLMQASAWIKPSLPTGSGAQPVVITALPLYHIFSLTANCLLFVYLAVQAAIAARWKKVTGCILTQAWGLTETSPAACINPVGLDFNGSIGLPISSTYVCIVDDDGRELGVNQIGEICVFGPQVTSGYWNRPDETEKAFLQGWLRTGDIGRIDSEGFVYIEDRKKDMILVSGFNVYPNEIEGIAAEHPGVAESAAVAKADADSGEVVAIFIVKKNENLGAEELLLHFRKHLTGYKVPKHIYFRAELPKTNVGKILRRALRDELREAAAAYKPPEKPAA